MFPQRGRSPSPEPEQQFPGDDAPLSASFTDALRGMVDKPFLASRKWQEQQWRADRTGAHLTILEFERLLIKRMARLGVPMFASEVLRSQERQQQLFEDGHSQAKAGKGPHPYGCAADVVHSVKGWNLTKTQWALVGHVGKEVAQQRGLKVSWGGDWKFYDPAHWEVTGWKAVMSEYPFKENSNG